jgi:hypothetical protein
VDRHAGEKIRPGSGLGEGEEKQGGEPQQAGAAGVQGHFEKPLGAALEESVPGSVEQGGKKENGDEKGGHGTPIHNVQLKFCKMAFQTIESPLCKNLNHCGTRVFDFCKVPIGGVIGILQNFSSKKVLLKYGSSRQTRKNRRQVFFLPGF